jgi:hypothetical protein
MSNLTAVVKVYSKIPQSDDTTTVHFGPDYDSAEENKVWAKYTPSLQFSMHVLNEVADRLGQGQPFLVTFAPRDVVSA